MMNNVFVGGGGFGGGGTGVGNNNSWNMQNVLKMNALTPEIQTHLAKVYTVLGLTVLAAAVGAAFDVFLYHAGGLLTLLASMFVMYKLVTMDKHNNNVAARGGMLCLFGFLNGVNLGSLVALTLQVDPSILVTAFMSTTLVFACFSASALVAKRREYLFLGGILSSAMSAMFMMSLMNFFFRSAAMYTLHLYLGLFVFCGYVIFDTQMIIEKASLGDDDFIMHGMELFVDFVAIFVRLVIILLRNSEKKGKKDNRKG